MPPLPNHLPHTDDCAYMAGWFDAIESIKKANAAIPPVKAAMFRCQECTGFMEIGQPAVPATTDAYGNTLWRHAACPAEITAPRIVASPTMPPEKAARVHTLRQGLDAPTGDPTGPLDAWTRGPDAYRAYLEEKYPTLATLDPEDQEEETTVHSTTRPDGSTHLTVMGPFVAGKSLLVTIPGGEEESA